MDWLENIPASLQSLKPVIINQAILQRMFSLIDLTRLNVIDTATDVAIFCQKAQGALGSVAACCVYPPFIPCVLDQLAGTGIKTATVINFPHGTAPLTTVLTEMNAAIQQGAQEVDVVFPYSRYLAGEQQYAHTLVAQCKNACGDHIVLKVILETGALMTPAVIAAASLDALNAGADFIKTSTGKITQGATLEAAAVMLLAIRHHYQVTGLKNAGLKVSGGIKHVQQAAQYMLLADNILGNDWVGKEHFRIGASQLVDEIGLY